MAKIVFNLDLSQIVMQKENQGGKCSEDSGEQGKSITKSAKETSRITLETSTASNKESSSNISNQKPIKGSEAKKDDPMSLITNRKPEKEDANPFNEDQLRKMTLTQEEDSQEGSEKKKPSQRRRNNESQKSGDGGGDEPSDDDGNGSDDDDHDEEEEPSDPDEVC